MLNLMLWYVNFICPAFLRGHKNNGDEEKNFTHKLWANPMLLFIKVHLPPVNRDLST